MKRKLLPVIPTKPVIKYLRVGTSIVEALIEEVGHEITQIFEYQIAVLKTPQCRVETKNVRGIKSFCKRTRS